VLGPYTQNSLKLIIFIYSSLCLASYTFNYVIHRSSLIVNTYSKFYINRKLLFNTSLLNIKIYVGITLFTYYFLFLNTRGCGLRVGITISLFLTILEDDDLHKPDTLSIWCTWVWYCHSYLI